MKRRSIVTRALTLAAALTIAAPGVYLVINFAEQLTTFEKSATVFYPLMLGAAFFWLADTSMRRVLEAERHGLHEFVGSSLRELGGDQARIFTTKKSVLGGSEYWNNLARRARRRLIIVGTTNKSWFNKDDDQTKLIAQEFLRISAEGGKVSVVAINKRENIEMMREFVIRSVEHEREVKSSFDFSTLRDLHFGAILSDDVLVIMPLPHHDQFREETMVIELSERRQPHVYHNYVSDLERLVRSATQQSISM